MTIKLRPYSETIKENMEAPEQRFWTKVVKSEGCWEWIAANNGNGYGRFSVHGGLVYAHRFSYEIHNGTIPDGMVIDHLCRNRRCVNPKHLEIKSRGDNVLAENSLSITAINSRKTLCIRGHAFLSKNIIMSKGSRYCRECMRTYRQRNKQQKEASK